MNVSTFLLMAFTSQQSLINSMNLRDIRLVMSVLFVLARIHSLMQKKKKLVVCFSYPMRNASACSSPRRSVKRENDIDLKDIL